MKSILLHLVLVFTFLSASGQANFTTDPVSASGCAPTVINCFDASSGASSWLWTITGGPGAIPSGNGSVDQNPGFTFIEPGNFVITLTINGGASTFSKNVSIFAIPEVDFTADVISGCAPLAVQFTDQTVLGDAPITTWEWDLGQPPTNTNQNPSAVFSENGLYDITLVVSDANGCEDFERKDDLIDVEGGLNGDFTADNTRSCGVPFTVNFTSDIPCVSSYQWTVTPSNAVSPSTSNAANPTFTFNEVGSYTISLVVTDADGTMRTITKTNYIYIDDNISVNIVGNPASLEGCAPLDIVLDIDAILPAGVSITNVTWDLPGGTNTGGSGTPSEISTTYSSFGDYNVTATVNFSGGCAQAVTATEVNVGDSPLLTANVTPQSICLNQSVMGTATSTIPNTQFDWYFENSGGYINGGVGTSSSVSYTYEDEWSQPFDVSLIGDVNGCKDTVINQVVVNPPAAQFTWERNCGNPTEITLIPNTQQAQFSDNFSWYITNGPGASSTPFSTSNNAENVTFDLGVLDVFEIQLVVVSSFTGCTDSITRTIDLLNGVGNAVITPRNACPGESITFFDNAPNTVSWQWEYGDGQVSNVVGTPTIFSHIYNATGLYTARLIQRSNTNCIDTSNYQIFIGGGTADIGGIAGSCVVPFTTSFNTNGSIFPVGGVSTANWVITNDAGTQAFNNELSPGPITFGAPGQYLVMLTAFDSIGCSDDTTINVLVGGAVSEFTSDVTSICPGDEVTFQSLSLGGNLSYNWSFPGGSPSTSTAENPVVTYASSGQFNVTLSTTSNIGGTTCSDSQTKTLYITVTGSQFDFVVDADSASCPTLTSNFSIIPAPQQSQVEYIKWYFELSSENPGFVSGNELEGFTTGTNIYTEGGPDGVGFYDVALVIETTTGCSDSIYKDDFIFVGGQVGQLVVSSDIVNVGESVTFTVQNLFRTDSILWDFGNGQSLVTSASENSVTMAYDSVGIYNPIAFLKSGNCPLIAIGQNIVVSVLPEEFILSQVYYDINQNKMFDAIEQGIGNLATTINTDAGSFYTNESGFSIFYGEAGNTYTLSWEEHPDWVLTTDSSEYHVTLPQDSVQTYFFGLYPSVEEHDVTPSIASFNTRCNSIVEFSLSSFNSGTLIENGSIEFISDSNTSIYAYSLDHIDSSFNKITWEVVDLWPGTTDEIQIWIDMPGVTAVGDTITFTANFYAENDVNEIVDTFSTVYQTIVLCSYDPNDKQVNPLGVGEEFLTLKDELLEYTVRFQNTGNDVAFDVTIKDILDDNLDLSTFKVLSSSHTMQTSLNPISREAIFSFPNINLPDSTSNEPESHGYITYGIKPIAGLDDNTVVENTADIIFDSNPAIVTNTVTSTLVDEIGGETPNATISHFGKDLQLEIYPNPFSNHAIFKIQGDLDFNYDLVLTDLAGKVSRSYINQSDHKILIKKGDLSKGIYFLNLYESSSSTFLISQKLIVK